MCITLLIEFVDWDPLVQSLTVYSDQFQLVQARLVIALDQGQKVRRMFAQVLVGLRSVDHLVINRLECRRNAKIEMNHSPLSTMMAP